MKPESECFWSHESPGKPRPEIHLLTTQTNHVMDEQVICCCGGVPVILEKLYGPTVFAHLRIVAKSGDCEWVIDRRHMTTGEWIEVARIPAQLESELDEL